ncbi:hypothetical protein AVP41_03276 [Microbacterium sp. TNHR37B]|nr:hypothetical protein AVP41_03276 [Microbacterium sp. TNHR37B]
MTAAERLVRLLAATLPRASRDRYREEWTADLDGAAEIGMARGAIVRGAAVTALTIDRGDPGHTGMPRTALAARLARRAVATGGSAAVLAAGWSFSGGQSSLWAEGLPGGAVFAAIGAGLGLLALAFGALALVLSLSAVSALAGRTARGALLLTAVVAVFGAVVAAGIAQRGLALLAVPLVGVLLAFAIAASTGPAGTRKVRTVSGLAFAGLALIVLTGAVIHTTVWNPSARVPALPLEQIYAEMIAQRQLTPDFGIGVGVWAAMCLGAIVLFALATSLPGATRTLPLRRLIVLGCLLVGGIVFTQWFAAFGIGMALADTFATSGADAAWSGALLGIVGQVALVAALLVGLTGPARQPDAEPSPAPAPTLP